MLRSEEARWKWPAVSGWWKWTIMILVGAPRRSVNHSEEAPHRTSLSSTKYSLYFKSSRIWRWTHAYASLMRCSRDDHRLFPSCQSRSVNCWCSCGSVVEHCVSSAKGCGFNSCIHVNVNLLKVVTILGLLHFSVLWQNIRNLISALFLSQNTIILWLFVQMIINIYILLFIE